MGKKPYFILDLLTPFKEYMHTAIADMEENSTILVLKTSATKVIPKGAGQLPDCMVRIPLLHTSANKRALTIRIAILAIMVMICCMKTFCHKAKSTIAVAICINKGRIMKLFVIYLARKYLGRPDYLIR